MLATCALAIADEHGGIHIHTRYGEEIEGDSSTPNYCIQMRPWYYHQWYCDCDNIREQADRLQDDTAWPGQREDFSDYLLR